MIFLLIKKVNQLSSDKDLAIMFQFIEDDVTKIEISLDNENWKELGFQGDKSDVYIFQGFKAFDFIDVYYRYTKNSIMHENIVTMRTDIVYENMNIENVAKDFRIRNKSGALIPQINIEHIEVE